MKLWEIDQKIEELIDNETGEVLDLEALNALQIERNAKLEGVALGIKNLEAEAKALKDEEDTLADRRRTAEAKAKRLKEWLLYATGAAKFSTPKVAVSFRTTKALAVTDQEVLLDWIQNNGRDDLLRFKEPELDKTAIKEACTQGTVPGAEIVEKKAIVIK